MAFNYVSVEQKKDAAYRKVEALYRRGYGSRDIASAVDLDVYSTLDVMQKIFASDMRKKGES